MKPHINMSTLSMFDLEVSMTSPNSWQLADKGHKLLSLRSSVRASLPARI